MSASLVENEPEIGLGPADFARRLLEDGVFAPVRGPLKREKSKGLAPRIAFLKDATKRSALRWLTRAGGWRVRAVVAGKRRREGRIWADGIWEALDVRFSAASLELVARAAEWATAREGDPLWPLPRAQAVKDLAPATTGDLVVFHLVVEGLARLPVWRRGERAEREPGETPTPTPTPNPTPSRGTPAGPLRARTATRRAGTPEPPELARTRPRPEEPSAAKREAQESAELADRRRALLAASPLTALFRADELEAGASFQDAAPASWKTCVEACAQRFAPMLTGDRAALLTYLDDALAKAWLAGEAERRAQAARSGAARGLSLAAALEGLAQAARKAGRPDALRPSLRFFERYVLVHGQRETVVRELRECALPLLKASDRERLCARMARQFGAARPLAAEADRILDTPFVERTEEEKLLVADFQERLRSARPELEAIRRELAAEVG